MACLILSILRMFFNINSTELSNFAHITILFTRIVSGYRMTSNPTCIKMSVIEFLSQISKSQPKN